MEERLGPLLGCGDLVGTTEGACVEGCVVGRLVVGRPDDAMEREGKVEGWSDATRVGSSVLGTPEGVCVGSLVEGTRVGNVEPRIVGAMDADAEGKDEGNAVGGMEGMLLGASVGGGHGPQAKPRSRERLGKAVHVSRQVRLLLLLLLFFALSEKDSWCIV